MPVSERPPYFPFFVNDFLSDDVVEAMSTAQVGAYILLLCHAWHQSPPASIPNDDAILSRWARMDRDSWSNAKAGVLAAFKHRRSGRLFQKRLQLEYEKIVTKSLENSERASNAAKERWNAEALHKNKPSNACDLVSESESESSHRKGERGKPEVDESFPDPLNNDRFKEAWSRWMVYRSEIRKKVTKSARGSQLKKLVGFGLEGAILSIEQSISNTWTGLFEPKTDRAVKGPVSDTDEWKPRKLTDEEKVEAQDLSRKHWLDRRAAGEPLNDMEKATMEQHHVDEMLNPI